MMTTLNHTVRMGLSPLAISLVCACSTPAFTGASSGSGKSTAPEAQTGDASAAPASAGSSTSTSGTALAGSGQAFTTAFAAVSTTDASTTGCALPANVASAMSGFVKPVTGQGSTALELDGSTWSTSQAASALGLVNLDLNSCEWFQAIKSSSTPEYMVIFTNAAKTQSYAQPFSLSANAITYAACISAALMAGTEVGGTVACDYVPTN